MTVDVPGPWRRIDSRPIYSSPFLSVREDTVIAPDGNIIPYGVATTGHAVGMLPFLDHQTVIMVRQNRYLTGQRTWEMPSGKVDEGEDIEAAAQRELAEEAGHRARRLVRLTAIQSSKSILEETAHLYLAADLEPFELEPDATEDINRVTLPFADVVNMTVQGHIVDAMTVATVLLAERLRASGVLPDVLAGRSPVTRSREGYGENAQ